MDSTATPAASRGRIPFAEINAAALSCEAYEQWLLDGKHKGNEYVALNPTRPDEHLGSFKINKTTGAWSDFATGDKGKDLVSLHAYLFNNGDQGEAARNLAKEYKIPLNGESRTLNSDRKATKKRKASTLWQPLTPIPKDAPLPPAAHFRHGKPTATWTYCDQQGLPLFHVYRFDKVDDKETRPLTYCQHTQTGKQAWKWQSLPVPRPLYNLHLLAERPDATVVLCEGEKVAEAASKLFPNCPTTTPPNGAESPHKADYKPLSGREVWIWPDNDEPGRKFARTVAELLRKAGARPRILAMPPDDGRDYAKGWDAADALAEGWTAAHIEALLAKGALFKIDAPLQNEVELPPPKEEHDGMPAFFRLSGNGLYYRVEDKEGEVEWQWICSPLHITARTRNADGENHGRLLELTDDDGRRHVWPMPMRLLAGDGQQYREALLDMGLHIAPGRAARYALTNYVQLTRPSATALCVERTGWHDGVYVLPDETIGERPKERVLLQTDIGDFHAYRTTGTLEDWQQTVSTLCVGNSRLAFVVSCAFAATLIEPTGAENGGFHLRGESSIGKSTALFVASSVYGGKDYLQRWRATANGLEAVATLHNDALLCLDEMSQVDPREAGEVAYMLANGQGKQRAQRSGIARRRQMWRLLFLSSGETSLAEHMRAVGKRVRAGQETRLVDIPADAGAGYGLFEQLHGRPDGHRLAGDLLDAVRKNHGTAARAFLKRLVPRLGELSKHTQSLQIAFHKEHVPQGASGQVCRVADRFALVAIAGELAKLLGITRWPEDEALRAAGICFQAWLNSRGGHGPQEEQAALAQVQHFFELHGEARFTPWNDSDSRVTHSRAGFRKNEYDNSEFYVFPEVFRRELCEGFDSRFVAKLLVEHGWLKPDGQGRTVNFSRLPGLGVSRCYIFTGKVLGEKS